MSSTIYDWLLSVNIDHHYLFSGNILSLIVLTWHRSNLEMKRSYWILIFSLVCQNCSFFLILSFLTLTQNSFCGWIKRAFNIFPLRAESQIFSQAYPEWEINKRGLFSIKSNQLFFYIWHWICPRTWNWKMNISLTDVNLII